MISNVKKQDNNIIYNKKTLPSLLLTVSLQKALMEETFSAFDINKKKYKVKNNSSPTVKH